MNNILKVLCTLLSVYTIFLCAGLTAVLTPNFLLLNFYNISSFIKIIIIWITSIVFGIYSLIVLTENIKDIWKEN